MEYLFLQLILFPYCKEDIKSICDVILSCKLTAIHFETFRIGSLSVFYL